MASTSLVNVECASAITEHLEFGFASPRPKTRVMLEVSHGPCAPLRFFFISRRNATQLGPLLWSSSISLM